jgi:WD repeat-containing protein 48
METFSNWCSVDTKIGAITVHLDEHTCFDCEMYADEANLSPDYEIREEQRSKFSNLLRSIAQNKRLTWIE